MYKIVVYNALQNLLSSQNFKHKVNKMNKVIEVFLCMVIAQAMMVGFFGLLGFLMADFTMIPVMIGSAFIAVTVNKILVGKFYRQ